MKILVVCALLTPGKRTVSAVLRTMGLAQEAQYQNYHRVLNRAQWSGLVVSQILLGLLVATLVTADARVIFGVDQTLERRKGEQIRRD